MKYIFDKGKNLVAQAGYTRIQVINGEAEIDESDPVAVALAESHGGKPQPEKNPKRGKK